MPGLWEVVGGADKGGILVREGESLSSSQLPERLPTGVCVEELALVGDRLHFRNSSGKGPGEGWVSTSVGQKTLLQRRLNASPLSAAQLEEEGLGLPSPNVFALSDLHTDHPANMKLFRELPQRPNDVVILAGDISHNLKHVQETFEMFLSKFGHVFYCPGNHDLWLHSEDGCKDSLEKLYKVFDLCERLGVHTRPRAVGGGLLVVPILSWYEPGFDSDPDVQDSSLAPVEKTMSDFSLCKWPRNLSSSDSSLAEHMDGLNQTVPETHNFSAVISFSHFLPRPELVPEKRYLFYPPLPKAIGSRCLGERVRRLAPSCHVFGHTHYSWDAEVDGIRYLQAAIAYPSERQSRGFALRLDSSPVQPELAEAEGVDLTSGGVTAPVLVYDADNAVFPRWNGFWSGYYEKYPRRPEDLRWLYRSPREKKKVGEALRKLIHGGKKVTDEAIEGLLVAK